LTDKLSKNAQKEALRELLRRNPQYATLKPRSALEREVFAEFLQPKRAKETKTNPSISDFIIGVILMSAFVFGAYTLGNKLLSPTQQSTSSVTKPFGSKKSNTNGWNACDGTEKFDKFKDGRGQYRDSSGRFCSK
jgi:hypothetical protein